MAAKGQIGSTALVIGAWAVGLYLAAKFLPGAVRSVRASSIAPGYQNNPVPAGSPFPALYDGVAGYDGREFGQTQQGLTPAQILANPNLTGDLSASSISGLQTVANVAAGRNPDGSPLNAAQAALLVTQYDQPGGSITADPYTPVGAIGSDGQSPSSWLAFDPGATSVDAYAPIEDPSALSDLVGDDYNAGLGLEDDGE